jgi:thiol-disulfide isomerase/thioredoxin
MKLKIRFPDMLLHFRKQNNALNETTPNIREKAENRYIIGLLILWLIVFLFSILRCKAQDPPLKVGDKLSDLTFSNVLNYKSSTLKLSDFKDKVVVLDFWATWCTSCLAKFPEERRLQQQLPENLQIILVNPKSTRNTHEQVSKFFQERNHQYDFPSIDEDTILSKLFPAQAVPHYAWIKNNVVVAIPQPEELTASNIRAVFENKVVRLSSIQKSRPDFRSAFVENTANGNGVLYYSFIGAYRKDLYPSSDMQTDAEGNVSRIDAVNLSLIDLIGFCATVNNLTDRRILKQVSNREGFLTQNTSPDWRKKYCFIYESTFTPRSGEAARSIMRKDIERYFQLQIDTVTRDTSCFVITAGDTSRIIHGKKGVHGETNILDHLDGPIFFHNESMTAISTTLEQQYGIPFINETGYKKKVNLDLPADLNNFDQVASLFSKQGFHIERLKRKVTFLLIKDQPLSTSSSIHN